MRTEDKVAITTFIILKAVVCYINVQLYFIYTHYLKSCVCGGGGVF